MRRLGPLAWMCLALGACLTAPRRVPAQPQADAGTPPVAGADRPRADPPAPAAIAEGQRPRDRVEAGELELEVRGGAGPVRASEEPTQDRVDARAAIEVARRALGDTRVQCTAALQSFDSGRRWTVECEGDRTVWVDAHTGDAEFVGSAAVRSP